MSLKKLKLPLVATLLTSAALFNNGCAAPTNASKTSDFVADRGAKNVALLIGAPNDLKGVTKDIEALSALFGQTFKEFNFEVVAINKATRQQMLEATQQYAAAVGENGTLFWYYSGHGTESGQLVSQGMSMVKFSEIADAMRQGRQKPFRRLIMMSDSCFSGQMVNGNQQISAMNAFPGSSALALTSPKDISATSEQDAINFVAKQMNAAASKAFAGSISGTGLALTTRNPGMIARELITVSAAQKTKTSLDMGSTIGGAFTYNMRLTWAALKDRAYNTATIEDLLKNSQTSTNRHTRGAHTPQYEVLPAELAAQKLFVNDGGSISATQSGSIRIMLPNVANNSGQISLYAAALASAQRLVICRGSAQQCMTQPRADIELSKIVSTQAAQSLFGLPANLSISKDIGANNVVTLLAIDAQSRILSARAIRFQAK